MIHFQGADQGLSLVTCSNVWFGTRVIHSSGEQTVEEYGEAGHDSRRADSTYHGYLSMKWEQFGGWLLQ